MKYWVVVPAYNEGLTIRRVAESILRLGYPLVVVDDGSTDDTAMQLRDLPLQLIRNQQNAGKGNALWRGAEVAIRQGADVIITLDADGQHDPVHIADLVQCYQNHPGSVVVACRLKNRQSVPPLRDFANRCANFWISWAAGRRLQDTQSGFRLYPAAAFTDIRISHSAGRGFVFESEMLIECARHMIDIQEVAIEAVYHANLRPSHYRPWHDTLHITLMVAWKLLSRGFYIRGLIRSQYAG